MLDTIVTLLPLGLLGAGMAVTHLMMAPDTDAGRDAAALPRTHRRLSKPAREQARITRDEPIEV